MTMATALFHGEPWAIFAAIAITVVVYIGLPIAAVVLALKYLRKGKGGKEKKIRPAAANDEFSE